MLKIISGGQTGIDQMGLQVGKELGLETGGTAPKGFLTENGPTPALKLYGLVEDSSPLYPPRTEKNVRNSTATIIYGSTYEPGIRLTLNLCLKHNKPFIVNPRADEIAAFLGNKRVEVLNVAGSRLSKISARSLEESKMELKEGIKIFLAL